MLALQATGAQAFQLSTNEVHGAYERRRANPCERKLASMRL